MSAEEADEMMPSLYYKNLVQCNAREPWRVFVVAPLGVPVNARTGEEDALVAMRIVPNYEPPYQPLLFAVGGQVAEVAYTPVNRTAWQTSALPNQATETTIVTLAGAEDTPVTIRLVLLLREILAQLNAPTCFRELMHLVQRRAEAGPRLDALGQLSMDRYRVLDQAWLYAIKWARVRSAQQTTEKQLAEAQALHKRVREAYASLPVEAVQAYSEKTLRHILRDYAEVT